MNWKNGTVLVILSGWHVEMSVKIVNVNIGLGIIRNIARKLIPIVTRMLGNMIDIII